MVLPGSASNSPQINQNINKLVALVRQIMPNNMILSRKRLKPQDEELDYEIKSAVTLLQQRTEEYYKVYSSNKLTSPASHLPYVSSATQIMSASADKSIAAPLNVLLQTASEMNPQGQDQSLNRSSETLNKVKSYLDAIAQVASAPQATQAATASLLFQKLVKVAAKMEKKYRV